MSASGFMLPQVAEIVWPAGYWGKKVIPPSFTIHIVPAPQGATGCNCRKKKAIYIRNRKMETSVER